MSETAHAESETTPKGRKPFLPSDLPSWLSAGANIGILMVGIVGVWTTVRISGLEDYFRSELAVRNEQIVQAESRLRTLQLDATAATQNVSALERQRTELSSANTALADEVGVNQRQLASNVFETRLQGATAATYLSVLDFYFQDQWPPLEALESNPGVDVLNRLVAQYEAEDSTNPYDLVLKRELSARCLSVVQTPVSFHEIEAPLPEPVRQTYAVNASYEEIMSTREQAQEQISAHYRSRRAYLDAVNERNRIAGEASERGATALRDCGRQILGASR